MTNTTRKSGNWSAVRQQITSLEKPALLALVKDLYESARKNRGTGVISYAITALAVFLNNFAGIGWRSFQTKLIGLLPE